MWPQVREDEKKIKHQTSVYKLFAIEIILDIRVSLPERYRGDTGLNKSDQLIAHP
jgi:hypothetical protein